MFANPEDAFGGSARLLELVESIYSAVEERPFGLLSSTPSPRPRGTAKRSCSQTPPILPCQRS
jgi:hypothetical protein